jgi:vanillate O-demethylase monooxygenase subunit
MLLTNMTAGLRRCWHVVATSDEVGDEPLGVMLLGEPWVLVRLDGAVRAFVDRCPHRLAPMSAGAVVAGTGGDELRCGYHGWRFGADARCTAIPALATDDRVPARARLVPAFAVTERYGLVWLAPEEPSAELPEFGWFDEEAYDSAMTTIVRTPVSAAQLVDNFLDAAHFPFVHPASFGVDEASEVHDRGIERDGWAVETVFDTWYRNFDDPLVATGEHEAIQPQVLTKRGLASMTVVLTLEFPVTGSTLAILFVCTPEDATTTRVYKLISRNDFAGDALRMQACIADEDRILREDLFILERYHEMSLHLDHRVELHTKADRLSLAWRRMMAELLAPERSAVSN